MHAFHGTQLLDEPKPKAQLQRGAVSVPFPARPESSSQTLHFYSLNFIGSAHCISHWVPTDYNYQKDILFDVAQSVRASGPSLSVTLMMRKGQPARYPCRLCQLLHKSVCVVGVVVKVGFWFLWRWLQIKNLFLSMHISGQEFQIVCRF